MQPSEHRADDRPSAFPDHSSPVRPPDLVGDIGGTHARFARVDPDGRPVDERTLDVGAFSGPVDAVEHYLATTGGERPSRAAIALATPILGDRVRLTNAQWDFSVEQTRAALRLSSLRVLNDFTALALALPVLGPEELRQVGGGSTVEGAAIALIGPGTGLGVSGLLPSASGWVPIQGEGGHCSLSPADPREAAILEVVWRTFPHVSTERLVSGTGLPVLAQAVAEVDGLPAPAQPPTPAELVAGAMSGDDPLCRATIDTFCAMLGTAAANLALTLGSRGGVYIGGGIVPRLGARFEQSPFRARFECKGRFSAYLSCIPTHVIVAPNPALVGAAFALAGR